MGLTSREMFQVYIVGTVAGVANGTVVASMKSEEEDRTACSGAGDRAVPALAGNLLEHWQGKDFLEVAPGFEQEVI